MDERLIPPTHIRNLPTFRERFWQNFRLFPSTYLIGFAKHPDPSCDQDFCKDAIEDLRMKMDKGTADIYEVTSIMRCRLDLPNSSEPMHFFESGLIYKCLLCAAIQTIVTPLMAVSQLYGIYKKNSETTFNICQQNFTVENAIAKMAAFCLCSYVLIKYSMGTRDINSEENKASYFILQNNKGIKGVNNLVYAWGFLVNIFSTIITNISAVIIIYTAQDALDIMLNSMAIFFVNDLDNVLATGLEYERALEILKSEEFSRVQNEEEDTDFEFYFYPFKFSAMAWAPVTFLILMCAPIFMLTCYGVEGKQ